MWSADLGEPVGHEQGWRRPGLVVSSDGWRHASTHTVLPLTRTRRHLPTRVEASAGNGLQETSYVRCEDVRAVGEERLVRRLGEVDVVTQLMVERTLRVFLEL